MYFVLIGYITLTILNISMFFVSSVDSRTHQTMNSGHFNCLLVRTCWTLFISISLASLWSVCGDTIPSTMNRFNSLEQGLARDQPSNEKNEENARLQEELIKGSLKRIEDEIDPSKEDDAYPEPEATEDYPAYLSLKNLLTEEEPEEKRSRFFKADLGKRFLMRGDLGKRFMMRGDLGKRFAMRSDLGKRFHMRGDLGKRSVGRFDGGSTLDSTLMEGAGADDTGSNRPWKRPMFRSDLGKRRMMSSRRVFRADLGK